MSQHILERLLNIMECEFLFPTPVWHGDLDLQIEGLLDFAQSQRQTRGDRRMVDALTQMDGGSYESKYLNADDYRDHPCPVGDMVNQVETKAKECYYDMAPFNSHVEMDNFWFVFTPPGDQVAVHTHPGVVFGGVTYIQVPEGDCGSLSVRRNLTESHLYLSMGSYSTGSRGNTPCTWGSYSYPPMVNKLILFPGWTPHDVSRNNTDEERISLAFNLIVKRGLDPKATTMWIDGNAHE